MGTAQLRTVKATVHTVYGLFHKVEQGWSCKVCGWFSPHVIPQVHLCPQEGQHQQVHRAA